MNEILAILLSERPLFITSEGYRQMVMAVLPYMKPSDAAEQPKVKSFFLDPPTYKEETDKAVAKLQKLIKATNSTKAIQITNDFENQELPADTIAYHRVYGFITGGSRWYFSSKQLEQDLLAAESNPQICAHLLHVNSSGGEAWYMDRLSETLRSLTKPMLTLCEGCMASAAYYIGCHGRKVYAVTTGDFIGSIGTMISFHDFEPYYESLGIKLIEVKADKMNATQMKNLSTVLETNGVTNQCSTIFTVTSANDTRAKRLHNLLPSMRIGITTSQIGTLTYTQLDQVKGNNETFVWAWDTVTLSAHIVSTLKNKNVPYECGIFKDDLDSIISYYSKGSPHVYNSGVETPGAVFKALLSAATFHDKAQWVSTDKGWKYQKVDKTFVKNSWLTLAGKKYYLNANGIMQTGWLNLSGRMYYLESDGTMVKGWKYVGDKRYYFGADGVMLTGTQTLNGHVYQFDANGVYVKKIK